MLSDKMWLRYLALFSFGPVIFFEQLITIAFHGIDEKDAESLWHVAIQRLRGGLEMSTTGTNGRHF